MDPREEQVEEAQHTDPRRHLLWGIVEVEVGHRVDRLSLDGHRTETKVPRQLLPNNGED